MTVKNFCLFVLFSLCFIHSETIVFLDELDFQNATQGSVFETENFDTSFAPAQSIAFDNFTISNSTNNLVFNATPQFSTSGGAVFLTTSAAQTTITFNQSINAFSFDLVDFVGAVLA